PAVGDDEVVLLRRCVDRLHDPARGPRHDDLRRGHRGRRGEHEQDDRRAPHRQSVPPAPGVRSAAMGKHHIAQVNVARREAPLDSPVMAGFVARLEEINALADRSRGFVWRLQTPEGDATYLRPFDDDRILINMSVWESVEALKDYVYRTAHAE